MEIREQIQEIIKTRNITQLIHFTKKKNIQSILDHGILNIDELKKRNIDYTYNDPERKDGWDFAISLSITNKNFDLYEQFKKRQNLSDKDFVEIKIDPSVLLDNECFFCDTNAANHTFNEYRENTEKLNTLKFGINFEAMFKDKVYRHYHGKSGIIYRVNKKTYETTCSQAEICLIGNINTDKFINYTELNQLSNG